MHTKIDAFLVEINGWPAFVAAAAAKSSVGDAVGIGGLF